ncbi:sensor histidine kinase [Lacticaseibacillus zhaodongensis]|uniref:sensor histidine kinase n=1 Tax=Lacticaseibacillus zhaodongensis TaxID=2668065 RepID=UPI0012D31C11|nr:HAMP domain-containing sensor histidine kinase [Lacticaseibacillus zhaodongensis]
MKLIYQQMLSFLFLIIVALSVVSLLFVRTTSNNAWDSNSRQLANYTDTLEQNALMADGSVNTDFLQDSERILSGQHVRFAVYSAKNELAYPVATNQSIPAKYWQQLKRGDDVSIRASMLLPSRNGVNAEQRRQGMTVYYRPVFYSAKLVYVIAAFAPVNTIQQTINKTERNVFIGFVISAIFAIFLSYFLAQYQVRKINRLRNATHEIARGNYDVQLNTAGHDEISELASDFGDMAAALQASEVEIERQEDRRRQFMADAAHEMRTPLTTINGLLEGLAYDAIPEDMRGKSIELMRGETKRLIRLVNENLDYEKIRTNQILLKKTNFNARTDLDNVTSQLQQKADDAGDDITIDAPAEMPVYADHDRFVQIIFNILQNAIQFCQNGHITITAKRGYHQSEFAISDTGIGMSPDQVKNIWDRYYKADPSRKNTKYGESGLGLAIVHQLVAQHGGTIEVESQQNVGTTFRLTFPDEDNAPKQAPINNGEKPQKS